MQHYCVQLLEDGFTVVDPDVLIDLGIVGNTGTKFLLWEMTFIFLLQEGHTDEEGSSLKTPTSATTLHVPAEDYAFFEELPVDMQREEEEASQALQLLLHASEGQAPSTNEASTSGTPPDVMEPSSPHSGRSTIPLPPRH